VERQHLRLELLKLTYTHGRDSSEAVSKAEALEAYVCKKDEVALPPVKQRGRPPQKTGTRGNRAVKTAG